MMRTAVYVAAAVAESAGRHAFCACLRLDKTTWWIVPGIHQSCAFRLAVDAH